MLVVADSSPINHLVRLGRIELLPELFSQVVVPTQVADEMRQPATPETVRAFVSSPPPWFTERAPSSVETVVGLDLGESSAISLARELKADLLLIDERAGRKAAVERQVSVVGTIGVLERAAAQGLVDLEQAFRVLEASDFRVRPQDLAERLRMFHERDRVAESRPFELRREPPRQRTPDRDIDR
jgi:predicted nucleic acid-binding protein